MNTSFKNEVHEGLLLNQKALPSKYFYDKKGDALFVEIMNLPEYYLTRSELDIFRNKTEDLIQSLEVKPGSYFELIELGPGDGTKTKELLKVLNQKKYNFDYFPIDISGNALTLLKEDLSIKMPNLNVKPQQGDYFEMLACLKKSKQPKIVLFLGSSIGNLDDALATKFIYNLGANLRAGDKILLGVDLIKEQHIVLPAYNDTQGVTAKFNLNLLDRINNELGGNFDLNLFEHQPEYEEKEGVAKSFIVSTENQIVEIEATQSSYTFKAGERIHTEISRKYNDQLIEKIIANTDFSLQTKILDSKAYFADYVLKRT
ncbi:L-histidine N(alpha)-methyltransferase [Tamlana sp. 2_MG-2023]|uniref:L-histidine N(alpha)-methyltransferase n=1 Tax=unclassified Tamlana TaxID=2614803 RepID=UPI0026E12D5E|nr:MULTISPECIES: L-histidine N(alpha)-methyltransferase [unclassified Tamlana]MDO6761086.1 L-histidine N(alpha)-methyltransferase [Tamlana sp. 2_MG-2023]MDO6791581.1 L-histidine N(alpha)-methyltransferase [Tamlana sp. 1_MG-2023]